MMSLTKRSMRWFILVILIVLYAGCGVKKNENLGDGPDPAFDDFERAILGKNWAIFNGNVGIINNSDLGIVSKSKKMYSLGIITWNASNILPDQFSEAVISSDVDPNTLVQVFVRRGTSDGQRYGFHWNSAGGGRWEIKRDGGRGAPVSATAPAPSPVPGDTIRIEIVGNTIKGFHNGLEVITAIDSVLTEPGQPGMALNVRKVNTFPTPIFESWTGGSIQPLSYKSMTSQLAHYDLWSYLNPYITEEWNILRKTKIEMN